MTEKSYTSKPMFHTMLIDLDNTIYPESSGLMQAISTRIDLFMREIMRFSPAETRKLRMHIKQNYGTTLQGLHDLYQIDKTQYLTFVHEIDLSRHLRLDNKLKTILQSYSQKKVVFSNADKNHIDKVLDYLGMLNIFDMVIDVHAMDPHVKPQPESFIRTLEILGLSNWSGCVFIDDYMPNIQGALSQGLFCIQVNEKLDSDYPHRISRLHDLPELIPVM